MPKKILYIEDNTDTLNLVLKILKDTGYQVSGAKSGKEGLKKFTEGYDLILIDILMPDMSGWDVYDKIRKTDQKVKVAFLSSIECSEERKKKLKKEGVSAFIQKPCSPASLKKIIKGILKA